MKGIHIDFSAIERTANFHFRFVGIRVDDFKSLDDIRSGKPLVVASLRSLEFHNARFTHQCEHIIADGGRAFHYFETDRQT